MTIDFIFKYLAHQTNKKRQQNNRSMCPIMNKYEVLTINSQFNTFYLTLFAVPLMMAYVTRYIYGTDKLRTNAFEVRGINGISTGVIHCDDLAILSQWLKLITDNIVGLTHLQVTININ